MSAKKAPPSHKGRGPGEGLVAGTHQPPPPPNPLPQGEGEPSLPGRVPAVIPGSSNLDAPRAPSPQVREKFLRALELPTIGAALVLLVVLGLFILAWKTLPLDGDTRGKMFVATECLSGLLWLRAIVLVRRVGLPRHAMWIVLTAAVAMRAIAFAAPPLLSSDMYRYVWDGRVQRAGINPYRYLPDAPELAFLRDGTVYPLINRADYAPTIYPPAAEGLFALAAVIAPGVYGMKVMMAAFDTLAIVALLRLLRLAGRHPAQVLIYAWLPMPVWEFAGNGHIDAAASGLLALALLIAAHGRPVRTGIVLAAAALTKFLPAVVLPAFWRPRDWRLPAAFVLSVAVFYAPYLGVGRRVLGFLGGYVTEEKIGHGGGIFVLEALDRLLPLPRWATAAYAVAVLVVLAAIAGRFVFFTALPAAPGDRAVLQARQAAILGAVLLVALSPHYPWYFGWLAPLACLASLASVTWLLAAAPLIALGPIEHLLIPTAVYVPAAALAVLDFRRAQSWSLR
jgi:alpha-1,6-mannosyltransferase